MTPEERARALAYQISITSLTAYVPEAADVVIAAAIRAAENDALERAAKVAMEHEDNERSAFGAGASAAAERIADAIRALKVEPSE
jgi:hypothetical protein